MKLVNILLIVVIFFIVVQSSEIFAPEINDFKFAFKQITMEGESNKNSFKLAKNDISNTKPSLTTMTLLKQFGGGLLLGIGGFFAGAGIADSNKTCKDDGISLYPCNTGNNLLVATIGCQIGISFGVFIFGNIGNQTSSFGSTFLGGVLGTLISIAIIVLSNDINLFLVSLVLINPIIGSVIGFNIKRKYKDKKPDLKTALINVNNNEVVLGLPLISVFPDKRKTVTINLLTFKFN